MAVAGILAPTDCRAQQRSAQQSATIDCPLDSAAKAIYKGETDMAYSLFEQVDRQGKANENIIISPLGLAESLSLLANGANGITLDQIMSVLGTDDLSGEKASEVFGKLNDYLAANSREVAMQAASSIWIDSKFKVKGDYTARNRNLLKADTRNTALATEFAMNDINQWCNKQTKGSIRNALAKSLDSGTQMAVFNAMYFNGTWKTTFDPGVTRPMSFTNADGSKSRVMMMQQEEYYQALAGEKMDLVRIPYLKGGFYIEIYLPHKGENLDDCMRNLNKKQDLQFRKRTTKQKVALDMPRMELQYDMSMTEPLKAMDITDAFSPEADFKGISDTPASVSDIRQITVLKFTEEGTEAANVTREKYNGNDFTVKPFFFTIDRPFFFTIREQKSNTILFMGKIRKL